jgi:opacity protein-like surface antigen
MMDNGYIIIKNNGTRKMQKRILATALLLSPIFISGNAIADDSVSDWQFEATPFLWASQLDGNVNASVIGPLGTQRQLNSPIDMSFSDIWERLDKAFMGVFEARKGDWIFAFEGVYFKLSDSVSGQGPSGLEVKYAVDADVTEQLYQGTIGRRVVDDEKVKLDIFGGLRYIRLDTDVNVIIGPLGTIPLGSKLSTTKEWVDPVIAARITTELSENWSLVGYADIGLTGMGSDTTYQGYAGANWAMAESYTLKMGYRYLYQDYKDGDFRWDMTTKGPFLGLGVKF